MILYLLKYNAHPNFERLEFNKNVFTGGCSAPLILMQTLILETEFRWKKSVPKIQINTVI